MNRTLKRGECMTTRTALLLVVAALAASMFAALAYPGDRMGGER